MLLKVEAVEEKGRKDQEEGGGGNVEVSGLKARPRAVGKPGLKVAASRGGLLREVVVIIGRGGVPSPVLPSNHTCLSILNTFIPLCTM